MYMCGMAQRAGWVSVVSDSPDGTAIGPFCYHALCGHQVISLCVSPDDRPQPTPPGTAPILLPPLRVAVLESPPPRRKVWGPKLPPVSKAKPSSGPFSAVQTNRTTLLLGTVRAVRGRWSSTAQQRALSGHSISFILQF
ncbi:unnamed protein product [Gadus morhua 'NCC']